MAKDKATKIASKKHLARLERERRQTRLITSVAVFIVVGIIGLIGYGILDQTVLQTRKPLVTVNDDSVNVHEYQVRVRAARQQLVSQYMQYVQFAQMFGIDPSTDSSLSSTLNQIQSQLDNPTTIGQQTIENITDDLIIRQYAKANGIVVTDSEVEKAIQDAFGFFPDGTPTPTSTAKPLVYPTWSSTQYALMTPTIPATLAPTQTLDLTATATTIPSRTPTGTATAVPSLTPSATPFTLEGFQSSYQDGLNSYSKFGMTENDFRRIFFESRLYRDRVSAMVTSGVTHEQDQVWACHILVADEATADSILNQLLAGADFATFASTMSLDTGSKSKGGDLGWFGPGTMVAEFESAAYALQVGEISQPVKSTNGWHIIQSLGHEIRPLTESEYQTAVSTALNQWLSDQRAGATIVISDNWTAFTPVLPSLESAYTELYETATASARDALQQQTPTP